MLILCGCACYRADLTPLARYLAKENPTLSAITISIPLTLLKMKKSADTKYPFPSVRVRCISARFFAAPVSSFEKMVRALSVQLAARVILENPTAASSVAVLSSPSWLQR